MNKTAIRNYAIWARTELIRQVSQKAYEYGISEDNIVEAKSGVIGDRVLTRQEQSQRSELLRQIKAKGYKQVMEEVAYTWFNRFIALRFMEVNGYLPSKTRVFSNDENEFSPQILKDALEVDIEGIDRDTVISLVEKQQTEELFKYLIIAQCNALGTCLPGMFETIENYTELLFPDNILKEDSVIGKLVRDIPEEDWQDQVQIIGWLYQYYNEERKNEVINIYKGTVKKEDIPAATQLFTTDWVVRYIVDNSLGRYWVERNPNSGLKDSLEYLVFAKNHEWNKKYEAVTPEELKVIDPCMGSGHFLVYAFDVLLDIYKECGYTERDAADLIVEKNIYGMDIDDRASQLAYFAVMMKARQYDRRFFTRGIQPHTQSIIESNDVDTENLKRLGDEYSTAKKLVESFEDAKEYGSIINVDISTAQLEKLKAKVELIKNSTADTIIAIADNDRLVEELMPLINQAYIFTNKYDAVFTNPPFLNKMDAKLKDYVNKNYKEYSGDLFSVFIYRNFGFCKDGAYSGYMSPFVWMFIKTYENLRNYIIKNKNIATLIQMEYSAFEEATVPICSFVLSNSKSDEQGCYYRLSDFTGGMEVQRQKVAEAKADPDCKYYHEASTDNFSKIPGAPIAYWAGKNIIKAFNGEALSSKGCTSKGIITGDNNKFLRLWSEISIVKFAPNIGNCTECMGSTKKWYPCNKGGEFRKWYGNRDYVINWENNGNEIMQKGQEKIRNCQDYNDKYKFIDSITWTSLSSGSPSFRYSKNSLSESAGMTYFIDKQYIYSYLAYLNSKVATCILGLLNPTLNFTAGVVASLPINEEFRSREKVELSKICVTIAQNDWDSYETSWDFKTHSLV